MAKALLMKTGAIAGGLAVAGIVMLLPLTGMPPDGQKCLAMSLGAIVWWSAGAMHPGFTSMALLLGFSLFLDRTLVPGNLIFGIWTTPVMYLVIGGFLIAQAVQESGFGRRLSLYFVRRFVRSYSGVIISCYVLGFFLSIIIPHPWPRSILLMSVMHNVIREAHLSRQYAANVGLAVFVGSIPTSMILLTGDSVLNPLMAEMAGVEISYLGWIQYMGVPGIFATIATCFLQLKLFKPPPHFALDLEEIDRQITDAGPVSTKEKWVVSILFVGIALWMTDSLTGIHPGWVALMCVLALAMPFVQVLGPKSWQHINLGTLLFLCAALAVGVVGKATGMNAWLAEALLPTPGRDGIASFMAMAVVVSVALHMLLGPTMAAIVIVGPAIIAYGQAAGIPPMVASMTVYFALILHWLFPFHHMNILIGLGEDAGGYSDGPVVKFGLFQILVVAATCAVAAVWWGAAGLL